MWEFDLYFQSHVWHVLEIKRQIDQEGVSSAFVCLVGLGMGNRNLTYHQQWRYACLVLIRNSHSISTPLPGFKR